MFQEYCPKNLVQINPRYIKASKKSNSLLECFSKRCLHMFNFDFKFRNPWFLHYWQIITGNITFSPKSHFFFFWLIYHMFRNLYLKTMASHSFSTYYLVQTNFSESCVQNNPCFLGCLKNNICVQVVFKTIPGFRLCSKLSLCSGCV